GSYYPPPNGPKWPERPSMRQCREKWNAIAGDHLTSTDDANNDANVNYVGVVGTCQSISFLSTVANRVGPNLTRAGFSAAVQGLGTGFDWNGLAGSFSAGKLDYRNDVRATVWGPAN